MTIIYTKRMLDKEARWLLKETRITNKGAKLIQWVLAVDNGSTRLVATIEQKDGWRLEKSCIL